MYGDNFKFDDKHKRNTLENFSDAYRNAKSNDGSSEKELQRIKVDLNVLSNSFNNVNSETVSENIPEEKDSEQQSKPVHTEDTSIWDNSLLKWKEEGWLVEGMSDQNDWFCMTNKNGNPGVIGVGFMQGHYYMQATYKDDYDFSKPLKWEKGGRRSYGRWLKYLAEPYYNIAEGKFVETFKSDKELQQYIVDNVDELKNIITRHHRTATWKNEVGSYDNWKIFIWYWDMLACEFSLEKEGIPYMDIIESEKKGEVLIQLANRKEDNNLLNNTLKRIGCQDKNIEPSGYVILEVVHSTDASAVSKSVKYWIERINC